MADIMEENTYTGFSIRSNIYWKYSRFRTWFHNYRTSEIQLMRQNLNATRLLRGTKSGPALIAATGPSLRQIDQSTLLYFRNLGSLFGINQYATSPKGELVPPNYLVLNDEPFWNDSNESVVGAVKRMKELILSSDIKCIVQPAHRKTLFQEAQTVFFHGIPLTGFHFGNRIDRLNSLPNITIFQAIATAKYLGYSPIYLVGYDLTFVKYLSTSSDGYSLEPHHHGSEQEKSIPLSSFRRSLSDLFGSMAFQIESLKQFKTTAVQIGYESFIDTLPRTSEKQLRSKLGL